MKQYLLLCTFLAAAQIAFSQGKTMQMSLTDVVEMARTGSYNVNAAGKQLEKSNLEYRRFKVGLKPSLSFIGTLPSFVNRTQYSEFLSESVKTRNLSNSASLRYTQQLPWTGGDISVSSSLSRYDYLAQNPKQKDWQFQPFKVRLNQPIIAFNPYKWNKKIEPLKVKVAERAYVEEQEMAALTAAGLYFDIYIGQISLEAAMVDKANADTLYRLSQGRFNVGKIAENELLQMELSAQRAEVDIASTTLNLQADAERLRTFLGIQELVVFDLIAPGEVPRFEVDQTKALVQAQKNRKVALDFEHRQMVADMAVDQARVNPGFQVGLDASLGLARTDDSLSVALSKPLDEEIISLYIQIPIFDFGKQKAERELAGINREIVQLAIDKERIDFEQDILLKVKQFDLVRNQTTLAARSFEIAQKRYEITRKRYLIGKIGVTELNIALNEQTGARQSYMQSLRAFWTAYYELRRLTLYDFEKDEALIFD